MEIVTKVSISKGQARITIPKEIAVRMGLLMETGEQGKFTHVILRSFLKTISIIPANIAPETTDNTCS